MDPNDPNLVRDAMLGRMNASTLRPHSASPGHETIVQHAQPAVAADGVPDEAVVERVARAIHEAQQLWMERANEAVAILTQRELDVIAARAAINAMGEGE